MVRLFNARRILGQPREVWRELLGEPIVSDDRCDVYELGGARVTIAVAAYTAVQIEVEDPQPRKHSAAIRQGLRLPTRGPISVDGVAYVARVLPDRMVIVEAGWQATIDQARAMPAAEREAFLGEEVALRFRKDKAAEFGRSIRASGFSTEVSATGSRAEILWFEGETPVDPARDELLACADMFPDLRAIGFEQAVYRGPDGRATIDLEPINPEWN